MKKQGQSQSGDAHYSKQQGASESSKQNVAGKNRSKQVSQNQDEDTGMVNDAHVFTNDSSKRDQTLMPSGQPDQPRDGDPMETGRR
jgi:hypothetical protein